MVSELEFEVWGLGFGVSAFGIGVCGLAEEEAADFGVRAATGCK